jgi:hypothetical protein
MVSNNNSSSSSCCSVIEDDVRPGPGPPSHPPRPARIDWQLVVQVQLASSSWVSGAYACTYGLANSILLLV